MKRNILYILLFIPVFLLLSCINPDKFEVGDIEEVKFGGFNDNKLNLKLIVPVNNKNFYNVKITKINLKAYYKDRLLGYLDSDEKIILKSKTNDVYEIPVAIKLANLITGMSIISNISDRIKQYSIKK